MGVVYEAMPEDGGSPVAIKVFYPGTELSPEQTSMLLERFEREGASLAQLSHKNVVRVIEAGTEGEHEYIVMEKLHGYNLKELLILGTRFTLAETFDIMLQLLAGLTACHRAGVIHRDVKPANVVRADNGVIKLTDFGIARIITDQTLSRQGTIVGTPNYMSPEQIRGGEVDPRTDVFSAGVLMYELLTGKKPFDGPDVTAIMYNIANVHPPSPRFYNGVLPEEIERITFKVLAKSLDERYSTADEFAMALRSLEQDLHYRDGTEAILGALPKAPEADAQAMLVPDGNAGGTAGIASGAVAGAGSDISLSGGGGILAGGIYCTDCGMANDAQLEFCKRCMRPLLKRHQTAKLAAQQIKLTKKVNRGDYLFLSCLTTLMVGVVILILYLFFRDTLPR